MFAPCHTFSIPPSTCQGQFQLSHLAYQCDLILSDSELMDGLRRESFDLAILDAFNPCSFLLAHLLGLRYVAFFPGTLNGPLSISLPSPLFYVPVFNSQLSDNMDFWGRELEDFISGYGEEGFVVVNGIHSVLRAYGAHPAGDERRFCRVPYGVIWRYNRLRWPSHLHPVPNVKLVEWLPQNDLLGETN
ncbi:hypothetical protein AAFF_G00378870 [Aldrovandia affinis]|uniref:glucuronosyltransferase n=1 Tax=Aldrovandia affinis TaxID=143900 RepID=A0AAD7SFD1_9TELE|nr:hypothetical protein AAFF_G00378870 [Aldrovandia affinis]